VDASEITLGTLASVSNPNAIDGFPASPPSHLDNSQPFTFGTIPQSSSIYFPVSATEAQFHICVRFSLLKGSSTGEIVNHRELALSITVDLNAEFAVTDFLYVEALTPDGFSATQSLQYSCSVRLCDESQLGETSSTALKQLADEGNGAGQVPYGDDAISLCFTSDNYPKAEIVKVNDLVLTDTDTNPGPPVTTVTLTQQVLSGGVPLGGSESFVSAQTPVAVTGPPYTCNAGGNTKQCQQLKVLVWAMFQDPLTTDIVSVSGSCTLAIPNPSGATRRLVEGKLRFNNERSLADKTANGAIPDTVVDLPPYQGKGADVAASDSNTKSITSAAVGVGALAMAALAL
jgi:hypothetical protein